MKIGQLVKIKDGVHEEGMPSHRHAVIVSDMNEQGDYQVMFFGYEKTFSFNEFFIVPLQKVD